MTDAAAPTPTDTETASVTAQAITCAAHRTADSIIADANRRADTIVEHAREEAKTMLAETKTFVLTAHKSSPFSFICSEDSKIGDLLDAVLGEAKSCYCCSALRMGTIGLVTGLVLMAAAVVLYFHY